MLQRRIPAKRWADRKGVGYTWTRGMITRPVDPLPALRVARKLMVDPVEADAWLERESRRRDVDVERIVDEVCAAVGVT